jgi:peptidoglycan/xylan/chitin deacetylase (PgdA/CDA1 family)
MNWQQLAEMKAAGMEIGSHTHRHAIIGRTPPGIAKEELLQSKRIIEEQIGAPCRIFCYPNGGYPRDGNEQTNQLVKEAGFESAVYMSKGMNTRTTSPYFITRYAVGQYTRMTDLREILSGVAVRAKRILGRNSSPQDISNRK